MTSLPLVPGRKLRVGVFGITGCAGCQFSLIFNEDELLRIVELIDLQAFPLVKEVNSSEGFDLVFMEGLVANNDDLEVLRRIRSNTAFLVALGACACTGCVPAYRRHVPSTNFAHLLYRKREDLADLDPEAIDAHARVDYYIPGCPPSKREILSFIKCVLRGVLPRPCTSPVCVECRRNGNQCLLQYGKPCVGPVTAGGCDSVCINGGRECWGCRGSTPDMNLPLMIEILSKEGFDGSFIESRLRTFAGLTMSRPEEVLGE